MESYKEYLIRCKTCGWPIARDSIPYNQLLVTGLSPKDAADALGIDEWCCRSALQNPTNVAFNMENRGVIEGTVNINAATDADARNESHSQPVFQQCLTAPNANQSSTNQSAPLIQGASSPFQLPKQQPLQQRVGAAAPGVMPQQMLRQPSFGIQTLGVLQPGSKPTTVSGLQTLGVLQPASKPITTATNPYSLLTTANRPVIAPLAPVELPLVSGLVIGTEITQEKATPSGIGIQVEAPAPITPSEFVKPTMVGFPTVNNDPTRPQTFIYVGANKQTEMLNHRTYLAQ